MLQGKVTVLNLVWFSFAHSKQNRHLREYGDALIYKKIKIISIANGQNGSPVSGIKIHCHFVHLPFIVFHIVTVRFNIVNTVYFYGIECAFFIDFTKTL